MSAWASQASGAPTYADVAAYATPLADRSGNSSSIRLFGHAGSFSSVFFNHA